MRKKFLIIGAATAGLLAFVPIAFAAGIFDIHFPVTELGGCADQAACKVYCDDTTHQQACTQFAVDHGFVSKENASHSEQIKQKIKDAGGGPGGCADENACRSYCQDPTHLRECVAFGERHGLIDQKNLQQIKKSGLVSGPGGCTGDQCREYCNDTSHAQECLSFAEQNNLISSADASRAKKFIAVSQQGGPGGCTGMQCRDYCADSSHHDECFAFAKKNGLITQDQANQSEAGQKIRQTVRESGGPGGCTDDATCKDYCTDPAHVEECIAYATAHGGVSTEQAQQMLKDFTEQKIQAGGDLGINQQGELQNSQRDSQQKFEQFRQLEQQFRNGVFSGQQSGSGQGQGQPSGGNLSGAGRPPGLPTNQENQNQSSGNGARAGPGGCTSPVACIRYCTEHQDECFASMTGTGSSGSMPPPQNRQGENQQMGIDHSQFSGESRQHTPQLKSNLIHAFTSDQLPADFQKLPEDARQQFFKERIQQGTQQMQQQGENGSSGGRDAASDNENNTHSGQQQEQQAPPGGRTGSPSQAPQGFPGRNGAFPGGTRDLPGNIPQGFPGSPRQFPGMRPDSGQNNFSGQPSSTGNNFPQGQSDVRNWSGGSSGEGHDQPFPGQGGIPGQPPPSGGMTGAPPSNGSSGAFPASGGSSMPPPGGNFSPPSGSQPPPSGGGGSAAPPSSLAPVSNFLGSVLGEFRR